MPLSEFTTLMARDGHEFSAWLAAPPGRPRGAVLVLQEIFGVNAHIRAVTDSYAAEGYVAIAPAVFDRVRRGVELGYTPDTMKEGFGYVQSLQPEKTLLDLAASIAVVRHAGRVGVVGFCWGGKMAYVSGCELPVACGVAYYGGRIVQELGRTPKCPMLYHFGANDAHIPPSDIEQIRAVDTRGIFHVYPGADHGFNCDMRASFNAEAAQLARARTLAFLAQHLRGESAQQQQ
jgi:carboxymethylenebutenolidase